MPAFDFSRRSLGLRYDRLMLNRATRFASKTWSIPVEDLELSLKEIVGGLESRVVRAIFRSPLLKELGAAMRLSAKMTDPQTANQFTGLVIVPAFMILIGIFGKVLTISRAP